MLDPASNLTADQRALFATTSRLLACLVTESLLPGLYYPLTQVIGDTIGLCVVLKRDIIANVLHSSDILAIIPLRHIPIFKSDCTKVVGKEIGLLDPMDMLQLAYVLAPDQTLNMEVSCLAKTVSETLLHHGYIFPDEYLLYPSWDPIPLWRQFSDIMNLDCDLQEAIAAELRSSVDWQKYSYEHPPEPPAWTSPSIEWEQSIVEGHPTHPMHKTRLFLYPLPDLRPGAYDLYHPRLRLVALPRTEMKITYDFERLTLPILEAISKLSEKPLNIRDGFMVIPVHELQVMHIQAKFPEAVIYPAEFSLPLLAQQSIRSVVVPGAYLETSLKLSLGVKLTSAVRTISPESAYLGPRFSAQVVPHLTMDPNIITVTKELASVVHINPDGEIAKHCAAIVREAHENTSEDRGERLIVCTALVESGHDGPDGHIPSIIRIFQLDSEEKRLRWLDRFIEIFFKAFLPPMLSNGVAFECHPQNCVARFDIKTKELKGFIIRDFGGIRVHPPTLRATTGVELDFLAGHSIIAANLDDVYTRMYHTVFHNHLQQLIRVLGLHYNGRGWCLVRKWLLEIIPAGHPLRQSWLSPERRTLPGKCFLRMRMSGAYRFHLHGPFPNLILYNGALSESSDTEFSAASGTPNQEQPRF